MRPPIEQTAISILRADVPGFDDQYLDLLAVYDEDLTSEIALMELADFVTGMLVGGGDEGVLEECFGAVERIATTMEDGAELVADSFLNELPLGWRPAAERFYRQETAGLAELLGRGEEVPGGVD
jgi:hypothetical protein